MLAIERRMIERAAKDVDYRKQVCMSMDIKMHQLQYQFQKLGLETVRKVEHKVDKDDERLMYELWADGMTFRELGEKFDITGSGARYAVKRYVNAALERGETLRSA